MPRPIVLTIAGSDPSGGAGVQADLKTFAAWRTFGQTVISVLTAQSTAAVHGVHAAPAVFVGQCLDAVLADCPPRAVKTGMLFDASIIRIVAARLGGFRCAGVVVDPVMVAGSGDSLLRDDAVSAMVTRMLPLARVVTPNLREAEVLAGRPIADIDGAWAAAARILDLGPGAVLLKGGHREGPLVSDLLLHADGRRERFDRPRIAVARTHGTGCTLSAAIAAGLAHGMELGEAVQRAGDWVHAALAAASPIGRGGTPLDHCVRVEGFAS